MFILLTSFLFFPVNKGATNIFKGWCDLIQDPVGGAQKKHGGRERRYHGYLRQIDRCSQEAIRDPHKRPRKVSRKPPPPCIEIDRILSFPLKKMKLSNLYMYYFLPLRCILQRSLIVVAIFQKPMTFFSS